MLMQQFSNMSENEKWHRRLGHTSNCEIQKSVSHVKGMEELVAKKTFEKQPKYASSMIGKIISIIPSIKDQG
jgi:hypothetical protein